MSSVNDWPMAKLGEICNLPERWKKKDTKSYSYIDIASIDNQAKTITTTQQITSTVAPSRATTHVSAGDVLVSTVRPNLNAVAIVPPGLSDAIASSGLSVLRTIRHKADPRYLFHAVQTNFFIQQCCDLATGASYPAVSDSKIRSISIPLPPLAEQQRIAGILDVSRNIELSQRLAIQRYTDLASQVVEEAVRKSVVTSTLEELATINGGLSLSKRRTTLPLSAPYLRVANVFRNEIDFSEVKEIGCTSEEVKRTELLAGDILMTEAHGNRKEVGRVAMLQQDLENFTYQNHLFRIRSSGKISPLVLSYLLNSRTVRQQLVQLATTTSGLHTISISKARCLQIPMPDEHTASNLNDALEGIRVLSTNARKQLKLLENLRLSLSARAFAGQL